LEILHTPESMQQPMPDAIPEDTPDQILTSALQGCSGGKTPAIAAIAEALQHIERTAKRKGSIEYSALLGTWRLVLVTRPNRTNSSRQLRKVSGQQIPSWVEIEIIYENSPLPIVNSSLPPDAMDAGIVHNRVKLGALKLTLSGPTLLRSNNILAFDFTHLTLQIGKLTIYSGEVRGGMAQDTRFYQQSLKTQAFFKFFWLTPIGLAARGRGGGLAMWSKAEGPA
jgi:hypothetical protein